MRAYDYTTKNGDPVMVIHLNEMTGNCCICGVECYLDYAVGYCCGPTHDEIGSMSTEYPGLEVGGNVACKKCHDDFYGITEEVK